MTKFNTPLAMSVLERIKEHPKTWNQETWRCETGMCFAGWAVELSGLRWAYPADSYDCTVVQHPDGTFGQVDSAAAELLGFAGIDDSADALFSPTNKLEDLETGVRELSNGNKIHNCAHAYRAIRDGAWHSYADPCTSRKAQS